MAVPHLSVIIPAYNEASRIIPTLEAVSRYLAAQPYAWEVIVVDDGSIDATASVVSDWMAQRDGFRLERIRHGGKGAAVRRGMLTAAGENRLMCDADLAMPVEHIADFLAHMAQGYDIVIGSRRAAGANRYDESAIGHLRARVFNLWVQSLALRGFQDTQCGFKCFSAHAAQLFALQRTSGWGFDVEVLYLASKRGMRILEMPIDWYRADDGKVNPTAPLTMMRDVLALRWRDLRGEYAVARRPSASARRTDAVESDRHATVAIVTPTYNEADNLPALAQRIFALDIPDIRLIIVDDNSPDGTGEVARGISSQFGNRLHLIERESKNGLGTAYLDGFAYAIAQGADYVLQMDADLSHAPEYIPEFLDALQDADVVIGSRYTQGGAVAKDWRRSRQLLSAFANIVIRIVAGVKVKDCTTGFKAFRSDALRSLDLEQFRCKGYGFQVEVAYACQRRGYRVVEYPITFYDRARGESKLSLGIIVEVLWWLMTLPFRKKAHRSL